MRNLTPLLTAHIKSRATTLCHIWTITRADGQRLGFTDHDQTLVIDGLDYQAMSGMSGGDTDGSLGFSIDNGHVKSVLSDTRISTDDINAGLYDGATLTCELINWQDLSQRQALTRGQLGKITQQDNYFEAEWIGEGAKLDRTQGRVFSRICDASFGDARCGLNAANFAAGTQCPRSYQACKEIFNNLINFRGFPYLIGDDALTAAPLETDRRDGGSRYQDIL